MRCSLIISTDKSSRKRQPCLVVYAFILTLLGARAHGQQYNPNISQSLEKLENSVELVLKLESFGLKSVGSNNSIKTIEWLASEYKDYGYDSIVIDSFDQGGKTYRNLIVTKPGVISEYLIVCGHFDTRGGPGASDNGSGVSAIMETARIVAGLNTTRTVMFVHFDGEEEGFIGSQHFVDNWLAKSSGPLYMVLNIDQIGGTRGESGNDKIKCERDESDVPFTNNILSSKITDTVANLCELYTSLTPVISNAYSSDYVPFEENGEVITGLYQNANDLYSHRAADTVGNMDTASFKQAVRLTAAATIHFARVPQFVSVNNASVGFPRIYPNPAIDYVQLWLEPTYGKAEVKVYDALGKEVSVRVDQSGKMDVSKLVNGLYSVQVFTNGSFRTESLIVAR